MNHVKNNYKIKLILKFVNRTIDVKLTPIFKMK